MERRKASERYWKRGAGAALVLALGCGGGGEVTGTPPGSDRLALTVAVSKGEFIRGDSTVIVVSLRNVSDDRVRVSFETTCTIVYGIRQAGGQVVVPSGGQWSCAPFESTIDLGPSQFTQRAYVWKGINAEAGDYLIFGALGAQMDPQTAAVAVRLIDPS